MAEQTIYNVDTDYSLVEVTDSLISVEDFGVKYKKTFGEVDCQKVMIFTNKKHEEVIYVRGPVGLDGKFLY